VAPFGRFDGFEKTPIDASRILDDPSLLDTADNLYVMIRDMSIRGTYKNLIEAINILAEREWETVSIAADNNYMYALCRSPHFKRKNIGDTE
jgi:hypothetical protein